MNVAIIPARGGSKRIPHKNIRPFLGKEVIRYSIDAAVDCQLFDRILVSTDCQRIAEVAVQSGAEVPFVRPPELSDDYTPTIPVIRHAIQQIEVPSIEGLNVCCLYATAPFVCSSDIIACLKLLSEAEHEFVLPVTTFAFPIFRALKLGAEKTDAAVANRLQMIWPEHEQTRSQDLVEAYHDAGQFYWGTGKAWLEREKIYSAKSAGHVIPRFRVQDLDTIEDWQRAEAMYRANFETENLQ